MDAYMCLNDFKCWEYKGKQGQSHCPQGAYIQVELDNKQINTEYSVSS